MKTGEQLGKEVVYHPLSNSLNNDMYGKGLTKREYFAGLALQGLLSNPDRYKYIAKLVDEGKLSQLEASDKNAHKAVLIADSLLKELAK